MRGLIVAFIVVVMAGVSQAGDVMLSANGFGQGHRGNGSFTLKQVTNPNTGRLVNCWSQNSDNDGWVMSLSESGILTVTYCRNGAPQAVYRVTGADLAAQNIGLTTKVITGPVPTSVSIAP